jgi:hypothetical protein
MVLSDCPGYGIDACFLENLEPSIGTACSGATSLSWWPLSSCSKSSLPRCMDCSRLAIIGSTSISFPFWAPVAIGLWTWHLGITTHLKLLHVFFCELLRCFWDVHIPKPFSLALVEIYRLQNSTLAWPMHVSMWLLGHVFLPKFNINFLKHASNNSKTKEITFPHKKIKLKTGQSNQCIFKKTQRGVKEGVHPFQSHLEYIKLNVMWGRSLRAKVDRLFAYLRVLVPDGGYLRMAILYSA